MRSSCLQSQCSKFPKRKCNFDKVHVLFSLALKAKINYFIFIFFEPDNQAILAEIIDFNTIFPFLEPCCDDAMLVVLKGL